MKKVIFKKFLANWSVSQIFFSHTIAISVVVFSRELYLAN